MKKLSKLIALLLSLLMILSLFAACGDDKKDDDDKEDTSVSDEKDKDDKDEDEDEGEDGKKDKDDKKDEEDEEEAVSAEDMLVGEWECEMIEDGLTIVMTFDFLKNNTVETSFSKDSYDEIIDEAVAETMADVTDEEIEEEGFASREEAEEYVREMMIEELPYDDLAAEFEMEGTWELDGDTLTVEIDGDPVTAETDLSDGGTTITLVSEDGDEIVIKKVK